MVLSRDDPLNADPLCIDYVVVHGYVTVATLEGGLAGRLSPSSM